MSWKDKPKLNRWGNPQEKPKQISGKEKEDTDSLAAAIEGKKYVKGMYDEKPKIKLEKTKYKFSKDELKNMSTKGKTIGESIKYFAGDQDENENSHGSEDGDEHYKNIPQPYDDAVKKALKSKKGGKTIGESIKFFAGDQDENEESHGYEDQHFKNIPQNQYDDAVKNVLSKSKKKK